MPLTIQANPNVGTAFMIPQRFTVRSIQGRRIGTSALMNCMGLVIHSPQHRIGCVAHIEAEGTTAAYITAFQRYLAYMLSKIIKYGGSDGGMQVGLFGNVQGSTDGVLSAAIRNSCIAAGIRSTEISDQRNCANLGLFQPAGPHRPLGGLYGAIAYDPTAGIVDCYAQTVGPPIVPVPDATQTGIRRKQLQP
ncbi:hypothetical protein [Falsiroseomonas oryzae]|uniref:hypothetical protein n=1 Tax=Falsiroseomonas oryzae TaxID=2766473 RepID=UPI0022EABAE5|nr:hypothetical protein [Roseomonas sp. MO-31]